MTWPQWNDLHNSFSRFSTNQWKANQRLRPLPWSTVSVSVLHRSQIFVFVHTLYAVILEYSSNTNMQCTTHLKIYNMLHQRPKKVPSARKEWHFQGESSSSVQQHSKYSIVIVKYVTPFCNQQISVISCVISSTVFYSSVVIHLVI